MRYFSLSVLAGVTIGYDNDYVAPWKNDLRYADVTSDNIRLGDLNAQGRELIIPIDLDSRRERDADGFVREGDETHWGDMFFDVVDSYVRQLENHHGADFQYEAHHVGRPTAYCPLRTCKASDSIQKGWNVIMTNDARVHITWEGDMHSCQSIKHARVDQSNVICSFEKANEYCHRHGAELFIPDEYYWYFFFKPMCDDLNNKFTDINILSASYSQVNYWVNMRRVDVENGYNLRTSSSYRFFTPGLQQTNVYTGFTQANDFADENAQFRNDRTAYPNTYEYLLVPLDERGLQSFGERLEEGHPVPVLSGEELKNQKYHHVLGTTRRNTTDPIQHVREVESEFSNPNQDLNMKYISDHINADGMISQQCMMMQCDAANSQPKLQDYACDHNNVRPMCIIKDALTQRIVCPNDLLFIHGNEHNSEEQGHCGDNVRKSLVTTVFGKISTEFIYTRKDPALYENGNYGVDNQFNFVTSLRKLFYNEVAKAELNEDQLERIQQNLLHAAQMYVNCAGEWNNELGRYQQREEQVKKICRRYGIQYQSQKDEESDKTHFGLLVDATLPVCPCECPVVMSFEDPNAVQSTPMVNNWQAENHDNEFCCAEGYKFESEEGFNYEIVDDSCDRCVKVSCQDEFLSNSDEQTAPFWKRESGNYRKVWKYGYGKNMIADQNKIRGRCVAIQCNAPDTQPEDAFNNKFTPVANFYDHNSSVDYECDFEHCGTITSTCKVTNPKNQCTVRTWRETSRTCKKAVCSTNEVQNARATFGVTREVGNSFTFECNSGYEVYRNGVNQRTRIATTDICNLNEKIRYDDDGQCGIYRPNDITCEPVMCDNPDMADPEFSVHDDFENRRYNVGEELDWGCDNSHCGSYNSVCVFNPETNTASFTVPSGECIPKTCTRPSVENGVIEGDSPADREQLDEQKWKVTCNAGFTAHRNDKQILKEGSPTRNAEITCNIDPEESCEALYAHRVTCKPVQCNDSPCNSFLYSLLAGEPPAFPGLGSEVKCSCQPDLVQRLPTCKSVCTLDASGLFATWITPDCLCKDPECTMPMDIPHGSVRVDPDYVTVVDDDDRTVRPGGWAEYKCDDDYELSYTWNGKKVEDHSHCDRECYKPPTNTCEGDANKDSTYVHSYDPLAIWDPLRCFCKPRRCPKLSEVRDFIPGGWVMTDRESGEGPHYPIKGYNTADVQCQRPLFNERHGAGLGNRQTLKCYENAAGDLEWTRPEPCVNVGCPRPRPNANAFFAASLDVSHTCASLDTVLSSDESSPVWDDEAGNIFWRHGDSAVEYRHVLGNGNVGDGSIARFHCKRGFRAYNNARVAFETNNWGPARESHFDCYCENGRWHCNKQCRCEEYCNKYDFLN